MIMCLFTGFVRDKNHKSYPVHYCFKPQWISPEMIHEGGLAIYMYKCGEMWLTLKFADFVLAIDVDNADRFRLCGVVICAGYSHFTAISCLEYVCMYSTSTVVIVCFLACRTLLYL